MINPEIIQPIKENNDGVDCQRHDDNPITESCRVPPVSPWISIVGTLKRDGHDK